MFFDKEHIVELKAVDIYQKKAKVLENVNFQIQKGEFVYLIGRTGSGKSSLLKTLYADLPLQSGYAEVAGFQLHQINYKIVPFLRRKTGIVFQDFQLLFDRNVFENLNFVMRATGWKDTNKIRHRIEEVLNQVGLENFNLKMPHQLSGGEQQKLVIARALINHPFILFADEPTGNLDPEVAQDILHLFLKINKSGTAILMATHNHQLLDLYPSRTLLCMNGKLKEFVPASSGMDDL